MSPQVIEKLLLESTVAQYTESFDPVNTMGNPSRQYFHTFFKKKLLNRPKSNYRFIKGATKLYFYALFVCGHYFVQCGFVQVGIFCPFFWKTSFFVFRRFLRFFPFLCRIRCNLHKLYDICIIIVCLLGVRNPVF